ncbi:hypothetical protein A5N83_03660 [Rhodococcus sp. 1139]|nr:hypothetical protein A5N83_03660 [Rhodococcus sp. 1139]
MAITSIASNRLFGRHRLQQLRGARGDGKFGLEPGNPATSCSEFSTLDRAQPRLLSRVDGFLVAPVVDGLFGDIEP